VPRLPVSPTRSNLFRIRDALELAQEGHDILDKKREVLTTELMHVAHDATSLQDRVWRMLAEAYEDLAAARLSMGRERLEWAALSVTETVKVTVRPRSVMGVVIPSVEAHGAPPDMPYGLGNTPVALDEAAESFRRVLAEVPELSELLTTVWRLALELQKTQRRVNALQYIFIPQYTETITYIEGALEEREREEIFRLKRLKSRAAEPSLGPKVREYEQPYRDIGGGKAVSHDFG
jgi:V/A-type H+-transporting ATPase subunit D